MPPVNLERFGDGLCGGQRSVQTLELLVTSTSTELLPPTHTPSVHSSAVQLSNTHCVPTVRCYGGRHGAKSSFTLFVLTALGALPDVEEVEHERARTHNPSETEEEEMSANGRHV